MLIRAAFLTIPVALLLGCSSGPPPLPPEKAPPPAPLTVEAPPKGLEAPVDQWKRDLAQRLPSPWRFDRIDAQVAAPPGWTKTNGDRGLALWLTNGTERQVFYVMPKEFDGYVSDQAIAAQLRAEHGDLRLYAPRTRAPGWAADDEFIAAIGLAPFSPERALVLDRRATNADLETISESIARFRQDVGFHPLRLSQLWAAPKGVDTWKGPYFNGPAYDPWGGDYHYETFAGGFELTSYGADGAPGGEGADQDIVGGETLQK